MTLADGNYTITAQATDIAGNVSHLSNAFNVTVETVRLAGHRRGEPDAAPRAPGQQSLSVVGTAPSNDQVQVYLGGTLLGTVNANGQGPGITPMPPPRARSRPGPTTSRPWRWIKSGNVSAASATFALEVGRRPDGRHARSMPRECSRARRLRAA